MHELSIAMSLLDLVEEEADRRGGVRIAAVHLKLGPLSGVVQDALRSAFEMARDGTDLADCNLVIREMPITAFCPVCGVERAIESIQSICCPVCSTPTPDIRSGRELEVCAMEVCS